MLKQRGKVAVLLMFIALGLAAVASAQDGPKGVDHYLCYDIVDSSGHKPVKVKVRDQFGAGVGIVAEPAQMCNPVDKNGEGILNREGHLVCYKFDPQEFPELKPHTVLTKNQFGETKIATEKPQLMCIPSFKKVLE